MKEQIKEITKLLGDTWIVDLEGNPHDLDEILMQCDLEAIAEQLYNAGYRKQSEGEWVEKTRKRTFWCSYMADVQVVCQTAGHTCSVCGKGSRHSRYTNFCPNCGAKMKGGAE